MEGSERGETFRVGKKGRRMEGMREWVRREGSRSARMFSCYFFLNEYKRGKAVFHL